MRFLGIVPGSLLVGFTKRPRHHGKPQPLLQLQLSCIRYGELDGSADDLGVSVTYKIHVGVEVPVEVLDAREFRPVPPSRNRAVACEYRQLRCGGLVSADGAAEGPADEAIVAEVLQPETEA